VEINHERIVSLVLKGSCPWYYHKRFQQTPQTTSHVCMRAHTALSHLTSIPRIALRVTRPAVLCQPCGEKDPMGKAWCQVASRMGKPARERFVAIAGHPQPVLRCGGCGGFVTTRRSKVLLVPSAPSHVVCSRLAAFRSEERWCGACARALMYVLSPQR
jgi:hypothetical protein